MAYGISTGSAGCISRVGWCAVNIFSERASSVHALRSVPELFATPHLLARPANAPPHNQLPPKANPYISRVSRSR